MALHNCHLAPRWLPPLEAIVERLAVDAARVAIAEMRAAEEWEAASPAVIAKAHELAFASTRAPTAPLLEPVPPDSPSGVGPPDGESSGGVGSSGGELGEARPRPTAERRFIAGSNSTLGRPNLDMRTSSPLTAGDGRGRQ